MAEYAVKNRRTGQVIGIALSKDAAKTDAAFWNTEYQTDEWIADEWRSN